MKDNIVLIGMMGAGKSTVAKALADQLCMFYIDTDDLIEYEVDSIPNIFKNYGEAGFRKFEMKMCARAASFNNTVIATGGGTVMNPVNVYKLKKTGTLVYLKVPLTELKKRVKGTDRPLLKNGMKAFEQLYRERRETYESCADIVVSAKGTPDEVADAIIQKLVAHFTKEKG